MFIIHDIIFEINKPCTSQMRRNDREISDIKEIESIISRADVCRVALADNNIPYIVTMNFGYSGGADKKLFFHCAKEGRKLDMIRKNNYVCFEFDTDHDLYSGKKACDYSMKYSSVVGWGHIFILTGDEEKREGLNYIMKHYTNRTDFSYNPKVFDKTVILGLNIKEMTGKQG
jgi:nitroimidazol reductase NimA-like FMN-containing flavoprotein (pyridoxamine 5'-phosphate oxidase superfamily)